MGIRKQPTLAPSSVNLSLMVTHAALAAAFSEWMRRYQEEPERFYSEAETLACDTDDYGTSSVKYLVKILGES